jgi:hypothetical protein
MDSGDDWYPDMFHGRFSVTSVNMLQQVVDKTICVESGNFSDPNYVRRAAMLATDDPTAGAATLHETIISSFLEPAGFTVTRVYAAAGGGTSHISAAVNAGVLFTVYFGHSGSGGWSSPSFSQSNVNALTNEGLYGLTMGWSCNTAHYDYDECFGETWLRAANKGAAAYLSASNYVWWSSSADWESSRRMENYFFKAVFRKEICEVGPAWQDALWTILGDPAFGPTHDHTRNIFEQMVLLGDPALRLPLRALDLSLPNGWPEFIPPDVPTPIVLRIADAAQSYLPDSGRLYYRYSGDEYQSVPLVPLGDGLYEGILPPPGCNANPEYYFSATGDQEDTVYLPELAPQQVLTSIVATTPRCSRTISRPIRLDRLDRSGADDRRLERAYRSGQAGGHRWLTTTVRGDALLPTIAAARMTWTAADAANLANDRHQRDERCVRALRALGLLR